MRAALALIGFTAVVAQIVLLRELMVAFGGNEVALGIALGAWLLWTAAGSALGGTGGPSLAALEALVAVAFPLAIAAVRWSRAAIQTAPGEVLGFGPLLITALVALGLVCPLCGRLYAVGSRMLAQTGGAAPGEAAASVYLLDAAGSAAGGLLASLWLLRVCPPFPTKQ